MLLAETKITNGSHPKTGMSNINLHNPVSSSGVIGSRMSQQNEVPNYMIYQKLISKENAIEAADQSTKNTIRSDESNLRIQDAAEILRATKRKFQKENSLKRVAVIDVEDIDDESRTIESEFSKNDGDTQTVTNRVETCTPENSDSQNDHESSPDSSPLHNTIDNQLTAKDISLANPDGNEVDYQTFKKRRRTEQNRISQRRFRIKNKLYIQELEEKIQSFELVKTEMSKIKKENETLKAKLLSVLEELHGLNDKVRIS